MKRAKGPKVESSSLRRLRLDAEKRLEGVPGTAKEMLKKSSDEIIHELEVHQIDLEMQNEELERFNRVAVGRELRMIGLKNQVNEFCIQAGQPPRYPLESECEGH